MANQKAAHAAELDLLLNEVNPGPEALAYLRSRNPEPEQLIRALRLMRSFEIDRAQKERRRSSIQ